LMTAYTHRMVLRMDGADLQRLRRRAGLTQEALAARLGVAPNTVARWEQGVHAITEPMARLIRLTLASTKAKPTRRGD
jgi:transcriptional regulator with XRE-family HTH domain